MSIIPINAKTIIDSGFPISNSFLLEHLTTGAFNQVLGKWMPQFSAKLLPQMGNGVFSNNAQLLSLVQNLQGGANGILEKLLSSFGQDLNIKAAFLNNLPVGNIINELGHKLGSSIDISIDNFVSNPYHIVKDIQSIAQKASSINVMYGTSSSWFHINYDVQKVLTNSIKNELPKITSVDLLTGEKVLGIAAMRGYV